MTLRDYQQELSDKIDEAIISGARSILATCPTGGGKTHLISHRAKLAKGPTVDMAHRQELVHQISMALARDSVEHRILAPDNVVRFIIEKQISEFSRSFIHPGAAHTVASVDTLLARIDTLENWPRQVTLVQTDEGHHCLETNKWGRALTIFPNATGIGWTGTGMRPDRKSLRKGFGGVYDAIVIGPSTADLLRRGYLCPYRVYGPPPSILIDDMKVGSSGDVSPDALRDRAHKSTIVGDMVSHYLKLTPGKVGIAFLVDVAQAKETAERFNAAGVPAAWMSARETNDRTRVRTLDALRHGDLKVICNVDLLGEGVDVPRVEVVLDGRPTMSLVRYLQVFGRLLRLFPGKQHGVYLDLVGNVVRHGLPDAPRDWSLDVPERRKRAEHDEDAVVACPSCFQIYERFKPRCPHCGYKPEPAGRTLPEMVDGDLTEYSPELMASLMKKAAEVVSPAPRGSVAAYIEQNWNERAVAQEELRRALGYWGGIQRDAGRSDAEGFRLFWHRFGIDVMTAQTLGRPQAAALSAKIWEDINNGRSRPTLLLSE
jgi:DNA repair protein RadD